MADNTDIAIIGAGPVGLLLAILLGQQGRDVTLIERWTDTYDRPRAVTMDHEVARILATLGIDANDDPAIDYHDELYYWKNADLEDLQIVDWKSISPSGWRVTYWFNQPELEERLWRFVQELPSIKIQRGWRAVGLSQTDEQVTLQLEQADRTQTLAARYVIGADGANSFTRETLGIKTIDKGYFFDWLILDMIPKGDFKVSPAQWQLCDPKRPTTIVPGGPGRRRWEFMVLPGEDPDQIASEDSAWALMAPWGLTPENAELERSAVYRFQARWAETWRVGRCLIAGDAAHLMPPFAGEGMCAGLRDAVSLGWRLNAILDGTLDDAVLDSYVSERIHHARHYIDFSQELGKIICIADPDAAAERDRKMMAELAARGHQPIHGDHCQLGRGVWVDSPAAAELSTQGRVTYRGKTGLFDQTVGQGWFVLAIDAPTDGLLTPVQAAALDKLGGQILSVGGAGCDIKDTDGTYTDWMAELGTHFVILRPDFYTAATAKTADELRNHFYTLLETLHLLET